MAAIATVRQVTTPGRLAAGEGSWWRQVPSRISADQILKSREILRPLLDADNQLVERCLGGEEAAWEDLVKVHTRRVYGICYRFTGSDQEAQDLTQDVFLRVFRSLKSFRAGEGSFAVWLSRLARNLLIDH
jgi:hypothetical protein